MAPEVDRRIFWVMCPGCRGKFYCEYSLRSAGVNLICPYCTKGFPVDESPEIDDRQGGGEM